MSQNIDDRLVVTRQELCKLLRCGEARMVELKRLGLPVLQTSRGKRAQLYDVADVFDWYVKHTINRVRAQMVAATTEDTEALDARQEKARADKERADKYALENAVRRGELVEVEVVESEWVRQAQDFKSRMLALPTKAAPLVVGSGNLREIHKTLEEMVHEALRELSASRAA